MHGHMWLPISRVPSDCFFLDRHYVLKSVVIAGSRLRFGCYSPVRTGSAGQVPGGKVARWTQAAGGLRQQGRPNVHIR